jgi:hypothetical protein
MEILVNDFYNLFKKFSKVNKYFSKLNKTLTCFNSLDFSKELQFDHGRLPFKYKEIEQ